MNLNDSQVMAASHRVIGLDIHPESFTATAINASSGVEVWTQGKITMNSLDGWLKKNLQPGDLYVMEAGSNSFETVKRIRAVGGFATVLESVRVGQINKAYLKNDALNSQKIAQIYLSGLAHEVWIPDETTLIRREVLATYLNAVKDVSRNRNRLWAWLSSHGLAHHKGIQLTKESGLVWILKQKKWDPGQQLIIRTYVEKIIQAEITRKNFRKYMAQEIACDPKILQLLRLFGIGIINSFAISAVVGDISRFRTPKQLVAYIGLQPKVVQSGNMNRTSVTLGYGRRDLRSLLIQSAHIIMKRAPNTHPIARWGRRKALQKNKNIAAVAVARKLVVAIWYLLRGYFTNFEEVSSTIKLKLLKLATEIGTIQRREQGYRLAEDFIEAKSRIIFDST